MRRLMSLLLGVAVVAAVVGPRAARADPDELMPCKVLVVRSSADGGRSVTRFLCRGTFNLPSPAAAPVGGRVAIDVNTVPPGTTEPGPNEEGSVGACEGLGSPVGSAGYKCKVVRFARVLINPNVVRATIKADLPHDHGQSQPFSATTDLAIRVVSIGASDQKRYCGRFGVSSALKNTAVIFKNKNAIAPTACSPSGAFLDGDDLS